MHRLFLRTGFRATLAPNCPLSLRTLNLVASGIWGKQMSKNFWRGGSRTKMALPMLAGLSLASGGLSAPAHADPGCDDIRQLCKEATGRAAKCAKEAKDTAAKACKQLNDVRDASCTQAEIVCKPPVGEPG